MTNYQAILKLLPTLSQDEQANLKNLLRSQTTFSLADLLAVKENEGIICPECGKAETILKNGKRNGVQRYLCKECGTSFTPLSETFLSRSHKDFQTWKLYVRCMVEGYSLRKSAKKCSISLPTAFYWRHKLLDVLKQKLRTTKLKGIVEADDTFFPISYKGSTPPNRPSHKRGTPPASEACRRKRCA